MQYETLALFNAFYKALPELASDDNRQDAAFSASLQKELDGLNPIAAGELIQSRLGQLEPDTELLSLYDAVCEFQSSALGELYEFDESHHFVSAAASIVERLTGRPDVGIEALPSLTARLKEALATRDHVRVLEEYIRKSAARINEYRLRKLEGDVVGSTRPESHSEERPFGEFTHTRQAIAIHYLIQEALGVTNVDTTRLMELAHLLAAKNIPLNKETGKENIRNSGIKSAFNKAWKKEDANHLADLRFVLRFFKPLAVEGATGMQQAVVGLEKRIARISEKLSKSKD